MKRLCSLIVLTFITSLLLISCGKRGPLIYPDQYTSIAPATVEARQVGENIRLLCKLPVFEASSLHIYRQQATIDESFCSSCTDSMPLYKTIYLETLENAEQQGNILVWLDNGIEQGKRYLYKIALEAKDGRVVATSVPVSVAVNLAFDAPDLSVESRQTEVILNISGAKPLESSFAGYMIYRHVKNESKSLMPIFTTPVKESIHNDFLLKTGLIYSYSVRTLYKNSHGELAESLVSNEVDGQRMPDE